VAGVGIHSVRQQVGARGTHDPIGEDQRRHQYVVDTARRVAATYSFDEWTTPIFEDTRVFSRTRGETLDAMMRNVFCAGAMFRYERPQKRRYRRSKGSRGCRPSST
jgi:histidyl-tRNA synthetase